MESDLHPASTMVAAQSGVSWAAIAAGAVAAAALALVLIALGAGLGLSAVSPWSNSGVSAATFQTGTGIYLVIVAVMSSAVGGYLAARLRTKWVNVHTNEVFFRDTAHGFLAWAFATLLSASVLSSAVAYLANGTAAGISSAGSQATRSVNPTDIYVDKLFRPGASQTGASQAAPTSPSSADTGNTNAVAPAGTTPGRSRAEIRRLWTADFSNKQGFGAADKAYAVQVVAARTGLSREDAEKRVNDVIVEAKADADAARKGAAKLSLWLTAAMLFGAFAAGLAAVEGGSLRDGTWNDRVLTPRAL